MKAEQGGEGEVPEAPAGTQVHGWLTEYWRTWWTLHHDRPRVGGGMGPPEPCRIPWRDLVLWCETHPHLDLDLLEATCRAMDTVYLKHWAAQTKAAADKARRDAALLRGGTRR